MNFPKGGGNLQLKSQSAKISDNVHGGGYTATKKSKCQGFWQYSFGGGGNLQLKSQSAKISDNVHGGGGVYCN